MNNIKKDFPIFDTYPDLVYLDNGATSHKPNIMLEAINDYYSTKNSNIGRGVYELAELSDDALSSSRKVVASFLNASSNNIIFTSGCTDSINQSAYLISQIIKKGQKIVLSIFEHHANLLPWQRLAQDYELELVYLEDEQILSNPEKLPANFWDNVGLLALTHVSNVTGQVHPTKEWCSVAKKHNVITAIDGAQGVVSNNIDLNDIECDFYSFSAHKLYGPMGVGVLYISDNILKMNLIPYRLGGGIVEDVDKVNYSLFLNAVRFEAGTPNVSDIYAFSKVLTYLENNNWLDLLEDTEKLHTYLLNKLSEKSYIQIIKPKFLKQTHMVSFRVSGVHPHDVGSFLSEKNIAVRVGKHCAHPLHEHLKINSTVRASLGIYNSYEDVDRLIIALEQCYNFFQG